MIRICDHCHNLIWFGAKKKPVSTIMTDFFYHRRCVKHHATVSKDAINKIAHIIKEVSRETLNSGS